MGVTPIPRDSNGVYSLPTGYLAETGTTILPSQHNPPLEDIAAALTGSLPRAGTAAMTGPFRAVDGTAPLPGIAFASDPTTGFFKTPAGIGVAIGGVQVADLLKALLPVGLGPVPWSGSTAPAGWVLCYGQTLLRTTYAALWAFAQVEIAAGNTLFNNGDGTTTFGIPDMRGRATFGKDNMGGVAASRLTNATMTPDGTTLGATGGTQQRALVRSDLPNVAPTAAFTGTQQTWSTNQTNVDFGSGDASGPNGGRGIGGQGAATVTITPAGSVAVQSLNGGVTQTNTPMMPPALITNSILYAGV